MSKSKRVLFVCLGNICRSPAAEGVLQRVINERGVAKQVEVDSAGTSSFHIGEPADKRMRAIAASRGTPLTSRARMVHPSDFASFELILAMDRNNLRELLQYPEASAANVRLLSEFLDDSWPREVPDPYYGGDDGFHTVLEMLEAACPRILDELLR